jgi:hypothetical protein
MIEINIDADNYDQILISTLIELRRIGGHNTKV